MGPWPGLVFISLVSPGDKASLSRYLYPFLFSSSHGLIQSHILPIHFLPNTSMASSRIPNLESILSVHTRSLIRNLPPTSWEPLLPQRCTNRQLFSAELVFGRPTQSRGSQGDQISCNSEIKSNFLFSVTLDQLVLSLKVSTLSCGFTPN